jgi:hypothetical protein
VIATVRPGDEGFVTGPGAAETVDYTGDLSAAIRERYPDGLDSAIDAVSYGDEAFGAIADLVHAGGILVSTRGAAGENTDLNGVRVANANANPAHLPSLADLVVKGELSRSARRIRSPMPRRRSPTSPISTPSASSSSRCSSPGYPTWM